MFVTTDDARLPFPTPGSHQSGWDRLEMPLQLLFFVVDVAITGGGRPLTKTFQLGSVRALEDMIQGQVPDWITIKDVYVICPKKVTGIDSWTMYRLARLFHAQDVEQSDSMHRVYETMDGMRFVGTNFVTLDRLVELTEVWSSDEAKASAQ